MPDSSGLAYFWKEGHPQRMMSASGSRPISPDLLQVSNFRLADLSPEVS